MKEKQMTIHERLRNLRKSRGWTQVDLAKKIDTDDNMISYYENGKYVPSAEVLKKIAEVFNVSADYLLFDYIEMKPLKQNLDAEMMNLLLKIEEIDVKDKEMIKHMINCIITKNQVKNIITS